MPASDEFKKALRSGDLPEAFVMAMGKATELTIKTEVIRADGSVAEEYSPAQCLETRLDVLNGTIENKVGEEFVDSDKYQELQRLHQQQVALGNRKIQENFQSLQELFRLLVTLQQYNRLTNAEKPLDLTFLEVPSQVLPPERVITAQRESAEILASLNLGVEDLKVDEITDVADSSPEPSQDEEEELIELIAPPPPIAPKKQKSHLKDVAIATGAVASAVSVAKSIKKTDSDKKQTKKKDDDALNFLDGFAALNLDDVGEEPSAAEVEDELQTSVFDEELPLEEIEESSAGTGFMSDEAEENLGDITSLGDSVDPEPLMPLSDVDMDDWETSTDISPAERSLQVAKDTYVPSLSDFDHDDPEEPATDLDDLLDDGLDDLLEPAVEPEAVEENLEELPESSVEGEEETPDGVFADLAGVDLDGLLAVNDGAIADEEADVSTEDGPDIEVTDGADLLGDDPSLGDLLEDTAEQEVASTFSEASDGEPVAIEDFDGSTALNELLEEPDLNEEAVAPAMMGAIAGLEATDLAPDMIDDVLEAEEFTEEPEMMSGELSSPVLDLDPALGIDISEDVAVGDLLAEAEDISPALTEQLLSETLSSDSPDVEMSVSEDIPESVDSGITDTTNAIGDDELFDFLDQDWQSNPDIQEITSLEEQSGEPLPLQELTEEELATLEGVDDDWEPLNLADTSGLESFSLGFDSGIGEPEAIAPDSSETENDSPLDGGSVVDDDWQPVGPVDASAELADLGLAFDDSDDNDQFLNENLDVPLEPTDVESSLDALEIVEEEMELDVDMRDVDADMSLFDSDIAEPVDLGESEPIADVSADEPDMTAIADEPLEEQEPFADESVDKGLADEALEMPIIEDELDIDLDALDGVEPVEMSDVEAIDISLSDADLPDLDGLDGSDLLSDIATDEPDMMAIADEPPVDVDNPFSADSLGDDLGIEPDLSDISLENPLIDDGLDEPGLLGDMESMLDVPLDLGDLGGLSEESLQLLQQDDELAMEPDALSGESEDIDTDPLDPFAMATPESDINLLDLDSDELSSLGEDEDLNDNDLLESVAEVDGLGESLDSLVSDNPEFIELPEVLPDPFSDTMAGLVDDEAIESSVSELDALSIDSEEENDVSLDSLGDGIGTELPDPFADLDIDLDENILRDLDEPDALLDSEEPISDEDLFGSDIQDSLFELEQSTSNLEISDLELESSPAEGNINDPVEPTEESVDDLLGVDMAMDDLSLDALSLDDDLNLDGLNIAGDLDLDAIDEQSEEAIASATDAEDWSALDLDNLSLADDDEPIDLDAPIDLDLDLNVEAIAEPEQAAADDVSLNSDQGTGDEDWLMLSTDGDDGDWGDLESIASPVEISSDENESENGDDLDAFANLDISDLSGLTDFDPDALSADDDGDLDLLLGDGDSGDLNPFLDSST